MVKAIKGGKKDETKSMAGSKLALFAALCCSPCLLWAQQVRPVADNASVTDENASYAKAIFASLIDMLDETKGAVTYDILNRDVITKFVCKEEYNRTLTDQSGKWKGIPSTEVKADCKDGITVQFDGWTHHTTVNDGYTLRIFFRNEQGGQCFGADLAIKSVLNHGWTPLRIPFSSPPVPITAEPLPNTEGFVSKDGRKDIGIRWVSKEHPNSHIAVDVTASCLWSVDASNS